VQKIVEKEISKAEKGRIIGSKDKCENDGRKKSGKKLKNIGSLWVLIQFPGLFESEINGRKLDK
jgi:hypothetical protein